jgi:hypothetical protein
MKAAGTAARLAVAIAVTAAVASAAVARADNGMAEVALCGYAVAFPSPPRHFSIDHVDPFGRRGLLRGAEIEVGDSVMVRFDCFRPTDGSGAPSGREETITRLFEHTRSLGIFKQRYQYRSAGNRTSAVVTGERKVAGQVYAVRMEFHFQRGITLGLIASHRAGHPRGEAAVEQFIDSFRFNRVVGD